MTKTLETNRDWEDHWSSIVQLVGSDDLIRQAGRTIGGVPMPPRQIESTVNSVIQHLRLEPNDVLLDLCCGNGMVTVRLARCCNFVVGVDYSLELIRLAQERHLLGNMAYLHSAVEDLSADDFPIGKPTKVCMLTGLQYFTERKLERLLQSLNVITRNKLRFYFGDVPDAGKIGAFYNTPERWAEFEKRRALGTEAIGTWWERSHLISILEKAGYTAQIIEQGSDRCTGHYRFDVLAHLEQ
jgi:SAM-dependent methyltransferase